MRYATILMLALMAVGCGEFERGQWVKHKVSGAVGLVYRKYNGSVDVAWIGEGESGTYCNSLLVRVANRDGDPLPPAPPADPAKATNPNDYAVWFLSAGMLALGWSNYRLRRKRRA